MTIGTRVLVVEDDPDAAEVTCAILDYLGHVSRAAHSGREALRIARDFEPQIVMLDLGLSDLCGFEVARMLREHLGASLRLVAVTGYADDGRRERARSEGFDGYLVKPTSIAMLAGAVADAERCRPLVMRSIERPSSVF